MTKCFIILVNKILVNIVFCLHRMQFLLRPVGRSNGRENHRPSKKRFKTKNYTIQLIRILKHLLIKQGLNTFSQFIFVTKNVNNILTYFAGKEKTFIQSYRPFKYTNENRGQERISLTNPNGGRMDKVWIFLYSLNH